jgi:hypothetical protein
MVNVASSKVARALRQDGFARYGPHELSIDLTASPTQTVFDEIRACFASLPPDSYAHHANRYRRYSRAIFLPWTKELFWLPALPDAEHGFAVEFYQGVYNTEYQGVPRRFPEIPAAVRDNPLLQQMIRFDLEQALWLDTLRNVPVHVGVHLVKLSIESPNDDASSSPNHLHQDGGSSTFTFAHLATRTNAVGASNVIASPDCVGRQPHEVPRDGVMSEFTLEQPLDSYAVHDPRVSHYGSPLRRDRQERPAERGVVLVGLTPFIPQV